MTIAGAALGRNIFFKVAAAMGYKSKEMEVRIPQGLSIAPTGREGAPSDQLGKK